MSVACQTRLPGLADAAQIWERKLLVSGAHKVGDMQLGRGDTSTVRGAIVVEAAYAIPIFFVSFFAAVYVLLLAYRAVTLQFLVGEIAREVGTRHPNAAITTAYVQERAAPFLGSISAVELVPLDGGQGSESPELPPAGSVFTIRISSGMWFPLVGTFNLRASAVGVMERE